MWEKKNGKEKEDRQKEIDTKKEKNKIQKETEDGKREGEIHLLYEFFQISGVAIITKLFFFVTDAEE